MLDKKEINKEQADKKDNGYITNSHDNKIEDLSYISAESVGHVELFKCQQCPYMTLAVKDIKFHWQTLHISLESEMKKKTTKSITLKCPGCSGFFNSENTFKTHLKSHHKMCAKDINKLTHNIIGEYEKNKQYIASLEVVIEGHKFDSRNLPPLIEIPPDPGQIVNRNEIINVDTATNSFNKNTCSNMKQYYLNVGATIEQTDLNTNLRENCNIPQNINRNKNNTFNLQMSQVQKFPHNSMPHFPNLPVNDFNRNITLNSLHRRPKGKDNYAKQSINKLGRPYASRSLGITKYKKEECSNEDVLSKNFGYKCNIQNCGLRLFSNEKIEFHKSCHLINTKDLHCPECKNNYSSVESLHTHLWSQHQIDLELFSCDKCSYKNFNLKSLNYHKKNHLEEKAYDCKICFKTFKNCKQLVNHRSNMHNNNSLKKFKCEICGREVSSNRQLNKHIEIVHEKKKYFHCEHCQYSSALKSSLHLHMRSHTGEKPFQCHHCGFKMSLRSTLIRHLKRHSHEKKFKCKHCSYSCIQITSLKVHMKSKHSGIGNSVIFSCSDCPYNTINKSEYATHVKCHKQKELPSLQENTQIKYNLDHKHTNLKPIALHHPSPKSIGNDNDTSKSTNENHPQNLGLEKIASTNQDNFNESIQGTHQGCYNLIVEKNQQNDDNPLNKSHVKNRNPGDSVHKTNSDSFLNTINNKQNYCMQIVSNVVSGNSTFPANCVSSGESSNSNAIFNHNTNQTMPSLNVISAESNKINETSRNNQIFVKDIVHLAASSAQTNTFSQSAQQNIFNNIANNNVRNKYTPPIILVNPNTQIRDSAVETESLSCNIVNNYLDSSSQNVSTQLLHLPLSNTQSGVIDGIPRKKPKISVKSNLILKGPDSLHNFNLQQQYEVLNNEFNLNNVSFPLDLNTSIPYDIPVNSGSQINNKTLSVKSVSELAPRDSFISDNTYVPNYLINSDFAFPNMQTSIIDNNSILMQNAAESNQTMANEANITDMSDVKLENKPYITMQSESSCTSAIENCSAGNTTLYEIPKHTIPIQTPIKFEHKSDLLGSYIYQDSLFNNNPLTHLDNIPMMEELPASFELMENDSNTTPMYSYEDNSYFVNDFVTETLDENEIIVIDDASCDVKSLPNFGFDPSGDKFSVQNLQTPLRPNINHSEIGGRKQLKEKPRIISEVHISSDKSKMMNFAAVKNLGFKLEFPSIKNIELTLALLNDQQNKIN